MKIRLLDWESKEHFVEIPDDTEVIVGVVLSGDMVLLYPMHYDTSMHRLRSYYDGTFIVRKEDFSKLDTIATSYEV